MKHKNARIILVFFSVSILLFIFSCTEAGPGKFKIDRIYLIIIDTLRADHLSCYGYPRKTSPFIDSLAREGILFERACSQSSTTAPSHASIFTGLYPFQHRVRANGYVLDDSYTTLAEILSQNGFRTAAFASIARCLRGANIDQGFDFYEDPGGTIKLLRGNYRPARLTKKSATIWLDNFNPKQKLFMWLHFYDPHLPYLPPKRHIKEINRSLSGDAFFQHMEKFHVDMEVYDHKYGELYKNITRYDAEILYVDQEIMHFFRYIQRKGLNENALWIITSDHGEGLGQHKWYEHGKHLYQEEVHVPLIFYFPDKKVSPKRIDHVVENFDIFSTIIEASGIKISKELNKEVKSISLWGKIINQNPGLEKNHAFSERRIYVTNLKKEHPELPDWKLNWEKGEKYCLQDKSFKYIFRTLLPDEFYHLAEDPFELNNLINGEEYQEIKKTLEEELFNILKEKEKYKDSKLQKVNTRELSKLRSLGYIL
ncbi:MAG: sulfatase [Candidatus Aminicenantes bacterium]